MRRTISDEIWEQIKLAYTAGIGLREQARNMGIPEGTVLSRAKREGLTQQIAKAKIDERPKLARELAKPDAINAITPMQSTVSIMQQRAQRHVERIADISDRVVDHVDTMKAAEVLESIDDVDKLDRMARRTYGLVAEEVEKVNPDLVVRDGDGKAYTVRYEAVNAMLLNEFLKEHRKVQELEKELRATAAHQQKQIEALTARFEK